MILLMTIVLAIVVALVRGGQLRRMENLGLQGGSLVFAAIMLRFTAGILSSRGVPFGSWLQVAAYITLIYALWLNFHFPGIKLFNAGCFLNFLVIAANGGYMPVDAAAMARAGITNTPVGTHSLLVEQSRLWFLADIIPVAFPYPQMAQVISVGDLLIAAGLFLFIQHRMLDKSGKLVLGED
jgi:hypothetical protein